MKSLSRKTPSSYIKTRLPSSIGKLQAIYVIVQAYDLYGAFGEYRVSVNVANSNYSSAQILKETNNILENYPWLITY